jgi:hypothetical protein
MASRHYLETANDLNVAYEFAFELELARGNMGINARVWPHHQEITRFHFTTETAVYFYG